MDIIIIGAGSVGMLVASFLAEFNDNVRLIVRRESQANQLLQHGLVRKNLDGTLLKSNVQVAMDLKGLPKHSFVIIAVKYGELNQVYPILRTIHEDIPLLFLQNGLAHLEEAIQLPQKTIAFGSCQFGAERENDYTIVHRGQGVLKIAIERGVKTPFHLFHQSTNKQFQVNFEKSAENMLFEKALLNCFINPLTAILGVKNGMLIENPHTHTMLKNLYNELMSAFPEKKDQFPFEEVEKLCRKTANNTSSMLGDILQNRQTEIETIVGAVIKKAAKRGKSLPILNTLYHLILAIESGVKM